MKAGRIRISANDLDHHVLLVHPSSPLAATPGFSQSRIGNENA